MTNFDAVNPAAQKNLVVIMPLDATFYKYDILIVGSASRFYGRVFCCSYDFLLIFWEVK